MLESREVRRIQDKFERGEISEIERQQRLVSLKRPNSSLARLAWSLFGI
ncbi:hypothetical protein [Salipiger mucosus]|uniref:Uncharacterized protein n=1 Tax=Salipiger mucosus DSM 16094 TaxID=1123237 RepID=S9QTU2_9RHOB|nr:hypothetical protein [Salipiger mucosus]EPX84791.1 hypothetical protein Salmuc_01364 [Salipiger mucosus DSM 16094]